MLVAAGSFVGFIAEGAIGEKGGAIVPVAWLAERVDHAVDACGQIRAGLGAKVVNAAD